MPSNVGSGRRHGLLVALLAVAAGSVAALGHAPVSWPAATVLALCAAFWLCVNAENWRAAAFTGWLVGVGYFAVSLVWLVEPFLVFPERHGWMAPIALISTSGGLALFWAAAFGCACLFRSRPVRAIALVCFLTGVAALREVLFTGFPWALPAYVWSDTPVSQLAAFIGPYGLTALTLLLPAFPVLFRRWWIGASLAAAAVASCWFIGTARLSEQIPIPGDAPVIRLVQPNIAQEQKWNRAYADRNFENLLNLTSMVTDPVPDLVVWPETAVTAPVRMDMKFPKIAAAAGSAGAIVGGRRFSDGKMFNSMLVLDNSGAISNYYDKHHLVPFGEYFPFSEITSMLGLEGLVEGSGGFSPGPGPGTIELGASGRLLAMICYEAIFPRAIRTAKRPEGIIQITNDAWFGTFSGPQQHFAQARMRAVETGLPVIRVANTGISAMIDGKGRTTALIPLGQQGITDAVLPTPLPPTLYVRMGDLPVFIACLLALLSLPFWRIRIRH